MIQESESAQERITRILARPGMTWSPEEKKCVVDWFLQGDRYDLSFCAMSFFRRRWPSLPLQDAEDALNSFLAEALDHNLIDYNPTKGQLGAFLRSQLCYHCDKWAARNWRRQRIEITAPKQEDMEEAYGGDWIEQIPDTSSQANPAFSVEFRSDVQKALGRLRKSHRDTLLLFLKGNNYNEISQGLGVSIAVVKNRLHRSRERLRQELAHWRSRST